MAAYMGQLEDRLERRGAVNHVMDRDSINTPLD
jgi:hypothetical protein